MSLANLIVQPQAAYLITDSGIFDPGTTRLIALERKVHCPSNRAVAFTSVGTAAGRPLGEALTAMEASRQAEGEWPDPLTDYLSVVKSVFEQMGYMGEEHCSTFFAAGWSTTLNQAVGFIFRTRPCPEVPEPWVWHQRDVAVNPYPEPVDVWGSDIAIDLKDPSAFNPHTDAMQIVETQRLPRAWGDGTVNGCCVAGEIHLTEVTADGVTITTLHTYPDRVGELAGAE